MSPLMGVSGDSAADQEVEWESSYSPTDMFEG